MNRSIKWVLSAALMAGGVGCGQTYEDQRPDVNSIDSRDRGLQSKEVIDSTDQMAADLLADPDFNARDTQMLLVQGTVDNQTSGSDAMKNYNIFLNRLKVLLAKNGKGRITLIGNKATVRALQSKELDTPAGDEFGQGGNAGGQLPARAQPDFSLNVTITSIAHKGTSYYLFDFNVLGLKGAQSGVEVWNGKYEVKVAN